MHNCLFYNLAASCFEGNQTSTIYFEATVLVFGGRRKFTLLLTHASLHFCSDHAYCQPLSHSFVFKNAEVRICYGDSSRKPFRHLLQHTAIDSFVEGKSIEKAKNTTGLFTFIA